ncbi:MAG TPA: hypothetical protein VGQ62_02230, partial [Chloroflexota bacterium]|nr:hypothetical protein [Chloroflexota bacterium]
LMNVSYLLAGTASINPVLAALELPVILAWRVAGWWGLDRFILGPLLRPKQRRSTKATANVMAAPPVVQPTVGN